MDLIIPTFFITILFAFSLLIAFIIRKILIEKFAKPPYYVGFIFFLLLTIFIIFQGYQEYKEYHLFKDYIDFTITPSSFILHRLSIPLIVWFFISAFLVFALIMKKGENKRIYEMLNNLEKSKLLKSAQVDFMLPNKIVETGLLGNDIKLGSKFLFVIYPAYIIPYSWLDTVKVGEISGRYGSKAYYVNIILKKSFKSIKITFAKKEVCEKITELLLKKKYKSQNNRQSI